MTGSTFSSTAISVASTGGVDVTIGEGNEAQLRAFLTRHLGENYPGMPERDVIVQLDELPSDLPFDIAILTDFDIIGSVVQHGELNQTQIYLRTEQTPDAVDQILRTQLEAVDFTAPRNNHVMAGHNIFSEHDPWRNMLCSPDRESAVSFNAVANDAGQTDLFISISPSSPFSGPCADDGPMGRPHRPQILPQLTTPPNTRVSPRGSGFSNNEMHTEALLTSPLRVAELMSHYVAQFEALGWQQTGASETDDLAWRGWRVQGEKEKAWSVTVALMRKAGEENRYLITLRAQRER